MAKQTFTTGQVLSAAQMTSLQQTAMGGGSATAKTASYVLVAADAGTTVIMNAAGSTTITVNTALFAAGDTVLIQNIGAGVCTVTAGTATVNTAGSLALGQYEGGLLYFTATGAAIFHDYTQAASSSNLTVAQIATGSITSGTQLQLTGLTSYDYLILKVSGNTWGTGTGYISATLNGTTSTYDQVSYGLIGGTIYSNQNFNSNITTSNQISTLNGFSGNAPDNTSTANVRFLYLQNCKATGFTTFQWIERWRNTSGDDITATSTGIFKTAAAVSTIEYKQNNGYTFSAGTYTLWGA
jgi:hypothetical protein